MSELENLSPENIPNVNEDHSQEEIIEPKIDNMEVQHHPNVEKKGIKEYILEGLMIFLAVTMGFFAESIREYISEKKIEKEYIHSFIADLKTDTTSFNEVIPEEDAHVNGIDTLLNTLVHPPYNDSSIRLMYYAYRKYVSSIKPMIYTLRTITQLKNSGGLRLITNESASDSIVSYNRLVDDNTQLLNYATKDFMIPSILKGNSIFNGKYLISYNGESVMNILHSPTPISLLTNNETTLAEYIGLLNSVKQIRLNYLGQLKWHRERAIDMISFFQKEYHFEKE